MTESKKLSFFGNVPASGDYFTPLVDLSSFQSIRSTLFCGSNATVNLRWSMDGINTDLTSVETVTAGNTITFSYSVLSKFVQIEVTGATPAAVLRFQTYLNMRSPSSLTNLGTGAEIYESSSNGVRSIESSDTSVTVTQNTDTIDLTIGSVPSTIWKQTSSFIEPITLTQTSLIGGEGNTYDPIETKRSIVWGENNYIAPSSVGAMENVAILGSESCGVTGGSECQNIGAIFSKNCSNVVIGNQGPTICTGFVASENCRTWDGNGGTRTSQRSACIASLNCDIGKEGGTTRDTLQCLIGGSQNCDIDVYSSTCCGAILGSSNCDLGQDSPGGDSNRLYILGCSGTSMGSSSSQRDTIGMIGCSLCTMDGDVRVSSMYGCSNCSFLGIEQYKCQQNTMINCENSDITTQFSGNSQAYRNVMINTKNTSIKYDDSTYINCSGVTGTHKGNLIAGDSILGFNSESNDQCLMKFTNGYKLYTGAVTGVVASAGAASWASICERSKKDNIVELDYNIVLDRLEKVPIYRYNYKGNPTEQINIGPMAEEYHEQFTSEMYKKDKTVIESMDIIGLSLASIKGLHEQVKINRDRFEFYIKENAKDSLDVVDAIKHVEDEDEYQRNTIVKYITARCAEVDDRINSVENKIDILFNKLEQQPAPINNIDISTELKQLKDRIRILELQQ